MSRSPAEVSVYQQAVGGIPGTASPLILKVHPSGYYSWLAEPKYARAKEDQRLLGLIKHTWPKSGGIYGYRKIHDGLCELRESSGRHTVNEPYKGRVTDIIYIRTYEGWLYLAVVLDLFSRR